MLEKLEQLRASARPFDYGYGRSQDEIAAADAAYVAEYEKVEALVKEELRRIYTFSTPEASRQRRKLEETISQHRAAVEWIEARAWRNNYHATHNPAPLYAAR